MFGLRARDLVAAGVATGAAAGGTIDAALGGTTVLAGAAEGGLVGGVLRWLGGGRLAKLEVLRQPLGGARVRFGPASGANLVAVLLGGACLHQALLASRAHARRDRMRIGGAAADPGQQPSAVSAEKIEPRRLRAVMDALRGSEGPDRDALARAIEPLLASQRPGRSGRYAGRPSRARRRLRASIARETMPAASDAPIEGSGTGVSWAANTPRLLSVK